MQVPCTGVTFTEHKWDPILPHKAAELCRVHQALLGDTIVSPNDPILYKRLGRNNVQ